MANRISLMKSLPLGFVIIFNTLSHKMPILRGSSIGSDINKITVFQVLEIILFGGILVFCGNTKNILFLWVCFVFCQLFLDRQMTTEGLHSADKLHRSAIILLLAETEKYKFQAHFGWMQRNLQCQKWRRRVLFSYVQWTETFPRCFQ
ncbi:Hypothetical predicted protein [Olea europaea subsp. europaea]|uniref:Uncharacterized protein n=1 Tax=Olea europaea subsp. europaea TaxID=158383 RepID=A0A8S0SBW4_OLEEU|nr:Hypothetical predicted protein [Olea europaea subsp. europaea]